MFVVFISLTINFELIRLMSIVKKEICFRNTHFVPEYIGTNYHTYTFMHPEVINMCD